MTLEDTLTRILLELEEIKRTLAAGLVPGQESTTCTMTANRGTMQPQSTDRTYTENDSGSSYAAEVSNLLARLPPRKKPRSSKRRSSGSAFVLAIFTACGQSDSPQNPDAGEASPPTAPITSNVVCEDYVRTLQYATGERYIYTWRYGIVADVGPDDEFTIERCGLMQTATPFPCPAGATCTGAVVPPGVQCERSYRTGTFVDGKLLVYCGYRYQYFDGTGAMISLNEIRYASIRVERR